MQITFDSQRERKKFMGLLCRGGVQVDRGATLAAQGKNANGHMGAAWQPLDDALSMLPDDIGPELRAAIHAGGEGDKTRP